MVQKLMVDEKKCYFFGRNAQMNDFCIDHASCSRVHAAFVYHKHLNIAYLVDLGSTHGTFIGTLHIEPNKPTQLHVNSTFHFGASTRRYILRERPSADQHSNLMEDIPMNDANEGALLGLPESQTELDTKSRKRRCVTFNDEEIIINPEDIDPNVRNLVQTTVNTIKSVCCFDAASCRRAGGTIGTVHIPNELKLNSSRTLGIFLQKMRQVAARDIVIIE
uniref:FHA domain-containing protein n=1 Tax=Glossina pallidipes TaxID=7398 RepID=A0A1A9ZYM3_GLOPL